MKNNKKFIIKFECKSWVNEYGELEQKIHTKEITVNAQDMDFAKQMIFAHIENEYYPVLSKRIISINLIPPKQGAPPYIREEE